MGEYNIPRKLEAALELLFKGTDNSPEGRELAQGILPYVLRENPDHTTKKAAKLVGSMAFKLRRIPRCTTAFVLANPTEGPDFIKGVPDLVREGASLSSEHRQILATEFLVGFLDAAAALHESGSCFSEFDLAIVDFLGHFPIHSGHFIEEFAGRIPNAVAGYIKSVENCQHPDMHDLGAVRKQFTALVAAHESSRSTTPKGSVEECILRAYAHALFNGLSTIRKARIILGTLPEL